MFSFKRKPAPTMIEQDRVIATLMESFSKSMMEEVKTCQKLKDAVSRLSTHNMKLIADNGQLLRDNAELQNALAKYKIDESGKKLFGLVDELAEPVMRSGTNGTVWVLKLATSEQYHIVYTELGVRMAAFRTKEAAESYREKHNLREFYDVLCALVYADILPFIILDGEIPASAIRNLDTPAKDSKQQ